MKRALISLAWCSALLMADFEPRLWQYRRAFSAEQAGRLSVLSADRTLYLGSQRDLADVRIVRGREEVPYVLETMAESIQEEELRPAVLDRSVLPGAGLQLTLEVKDRARHNRLRIRTQVENFLTKVRIEVSDDRRTWAVAREEGWMFGFARGDQPAAVLRVDYPVSTRPYVRVTFFGWKETDAVSDAWLTHCARREAVRRKVAALVPARTEDAKAQASLLVLDLGAGGVPHDRLIVETDAKAFHRACDVETSADGKQWFYAARASLYRFPNEEVSAVSFPEQHNRYLRLRILNRDDRPVPVSRVTLEALERRIKFMPRDAGDYALYYGNPLARRPAYDLAAILARRAPEDELILEAGEQQANPDYRGPVKPWSERHPEILYLLLGISVLVMGFVAVRFLLKLRAPG